MPGDAVFKLGSFGNFSVLKKGGGWPQIPLRQGFEGLGFAPARGDDGHDRSFITRDFNRGCGKENGTIPFYRRFLRELTKLTTARI
jgi:hypothetical protein